MAVCFCSFLLAIKFSVTAENENIQVKVSSPYTGHEGPEGE